MAEHQQLHRLLFTKGHLPKLEQCLKHDDSDSKWRKEYALSCSETVSKIAKTWIFLVKHLQIQAKDDKRPLLTLSLLDEVFKKLTGYERMNPALPRMATTGNLLPVKDLSVIQDHRKLYQWLSSINPNLSPEPYAFVCLDREIVSIVPVTEIEERIKEVSALHKSIIFKMQQLKITLRLSADDDGLLNPQEDMFNKHLAMKLAELLQENPLYNSCQYRDEYPDFQQMGKDLDQLLQTAPAQRPPLSIRIIHRPFATMGISRNHYLGLRPAGYSLHESEMERILTAFLNKHNQAFAKARSKEEIIKLASAFSWEFINLHPLPDANGRAARLLTSYILLAYGINPPVFLSDRAIQTTRKQWLEWFREGIYESRNTTDTPPPGKTLRDWAGKIRKAALKARAAIKDEL